MTSSATPVGTEDFFEVMEQERALLSELDEKLTKAKKQIGSEPLQGRVVRVLAAASQFIENTPLEETAAKMTLKMQEYLAELMLECSYNVVTHVSSEIRNLFKSLASPLNAEEVEKNIAKLLPTQQGIKRIAETIMQLRKECLALADPLDESLSTDEAQAALQEKRAQHCRISHSYARSVGELRKLAVTSNMREFGLSDLCSALNQDLHVSAQAVSSMFSTLASNTVEQRAQLEVLHDKLALLNKQSKITSSAALSLSWMGISQELVLNKAANRIIQGIISRNLEMFLQLRKLGIDLFHRLKTLEDRPLIRALQDIDAWTAKGVKSIAYIEKSEILDTLRLLERWFLDEAQQLESIDWTEESLRFVAEKMSVQSIVNQPEILAQLIKWGFGEAIAIPTPLSLLSAVVEKYICLRSIAQQANLLEGYDPEGKLLQRVQDRLDLERSRWHFFAKYGFAMELEGDSLQTGLFLEKAVDRASLQREVSLWKSTRKAIFDTWKAQILAEWGGSIEQAVLPKWLNSLADWRAKIQECLLVHIRYVQNEAVNIPRYKPMADAYLPHQENILRMLSADTWDQFETLAVAELNRSMNAQRVLTEDRFFSLERFAMPIIEVYFHEHGTPLKIGGYAPIVMPAWLETIFIDVIGKETLKYLRLAEQAGLGKISFRHDRTASNVQRWDLSGCGARWSAYAGTSYYDYNLPINPFPGTSIPHSFWVTWTSQEGVSTELFALGVNGKDLWRQERVHALFIDSSVKEYRTSWSEEKSYKDPVSNSMTAHFLHPSYMALALNISLDRYQVEQVRFDGCALEYLYFHASREGGLGNSVVDHMHRQSCDKVNQMHTPILELVKNTVGKEEEELVSLSCELGKSSWKTKPWMKEVSAKFALFKMLQEMHGEPQLIPIPAIEDVSLQELYEETAPISAVTLPLEAIVQELDHLKEIAEESCRP